MIIASADPGLSGAVMLIDENGKILDYFLMPLYSVKKDGRKKTKKGELKKRVEKYIDVATLRDLFEDRLKNKVDVFILENVHGVQGSGVASAFKFGTNYAYLKAFAVANRIPFYEVPPKTWQKPFHKKSVIALTAKEKSMYYYKKIGEKSKIKFPEDHDGLIDAWLIGEWGRRNLNKIFSEIKQSSYLNKI